MKKTLLLIAFLSILLHKTLFAENLTPSPKTKCPVCGMFVNKYKDFLAIIALKNGEALYFDGAKDFFKFYLNPSKYKKDIKKEHFDKLYVTDYYMLKLVDAKQAYFVIGSDIYGPMGKELIPFEKYDDANVFMKDHKGVRILKFYQVNELVLKGLD